MLNTQNTQTPLPRQVLLRLPEDLATKLARAVPPRGRNQFLVDLIANALAGQQVAYDRVLADAAKRMNALEAQYPELARETEEWVNAELTDTVDVWDGDFDRAAFERDLAAAKETRATKP
jgi:hypothetical protein